MIRKIVRGVLIVLALFVAFIAIQAFRNWDTIKRVMLGGLHTHETVAPPIPANIQHPALLVFSKTNAFRHDESIKVGNAFLSDLAQKKGWGFYQTENGAAFSPEILSHFDVVMFNNVSGDVFSPEQQQAFKGWLEAGGGYVGIHAAGDNSHKEWGWYTNDLIGANFTQHTMRPQFQVATVNVESKAHSITKGLPTSWQRTEEWYSFDKSPRSGGAKVLVTVDEKTYNPLGILGKDLHMGDHPMVWARCMGHGRVLYSAFGHTPQSWSEPENRLLLTNALEWAVQRDGTECSTPAAATLAHEGKQ